MIKEIENTDFLPECKVYSGVKNCFGKRCIVVANDDLNAIRVLVKDSDYSRRRKWLDSHGYKYIGIQRYVEVIDFTKKMAREIEEYFPGYCHTQWNIW